MPSVFGYFANRSEEYSCEGKSNELIVVARVGKTKSAIILNNERQALLGDNTTYINGDIVTNVKSGIKYFITGKQSSTNANQAHFYKINSTVDIVRLKDAYNSAGLPIGKTETPLFTNVSSVQIFVSAQLHLYDAGLLATTTNKFLIKTMVVQKLDRIKINGVNYQIDSINNTKYENILEIQCSADSRKVT